MRQGPQDAENPAAAGFEAMGDPGLEPGTSSLSGRRALLPSAGVWLCCADRDHLAACRRAVLLGDPVLRRFHARFHPRAQQLAALVAEVGAVDAGRDVGVLVA